MLPTTEAKTPTSRRRQRRSAVTSGLRLHAEPLPPGGMGAWARRFRDLVDEQTADLACPEGLTESQRQLVRRFALIAISCEQFEMRAARGEVLDLATLELYGRLTDRLSRVINKLGSLKRTEKPAMGVDEYLASIGSKREQS